ncbi:hypothetical protein LSM04_005163 [Trypanosoma melophagium]|uniref:uncharacterized protein n=1 Tax=Trypanosoma melophagium TaxID=715481 RepID=UPI00351A1DB5|nr:hypothetical protein LSM04_005163 [Trypanosoma melophagium]
MMKRSCFLSCSLGFLNVISTVTAAEEKSKTLSAVVQFPSVSPLSLPFAPPPKWTAELSRRFGKHFPELRRRHHVLYMRAFIHPSFTTPEAINSTMKATVLLGECLLLSIGGELIVRTFKDMKRDEMLSLVAFILSDASLSYVLRHHWEMEDMLLTDASLHLFQGKALRSTSGLLQWLSSNGKQQVPDPYCAAAVKSVIGAVYLDDGLEAVRGFIYKNVLQVLE